MTVSALNATITGHARHPGQVIRLARVAAGLHQADLGAMVGYSQPRISCIERGENGGLDLRTLRRFAEALGIPGHLLGITDTSPEVQPPVHRREFLQATGAVTAAVVASDLIAQGPRRIGRADLAEIQHGVEDLRALDQQHGADRLHRLAAGLTQQTRRLLGGTYSDAVGVALHGVLAETLILAGWLSFDAGRRDQARGSYAEAVTAAQVANDDVAGAYTLSITSMQALQQGRPREAVALAQAGQRVAAPRGGRRLRALLVCREARGHAVLRDRAAAESGLRRASRTLEGPARGRDPAWVDFFDNAELAGAAGAAYVAMGDPNRGVRHLRDAARTNGVRNRLSWELSLAHAHAAAGDPAQACAVASDTLPLLSELSSARVRRQLRGLVDRVSMHNAPEARDFTQRVAALGLTA